MRFLINALSVSNTSGRHVLLGHLAELVRCVAGRHQFVVLWHPRNADIVRDFGTDVVWRRCPAVCADWVGRAMWENVCLRRFCARERIDAAFTPAGMAMPVGDIPQLVFCQNPWAMVPGVPRYGLERVKGCLQRRACRAAVHRASIMVFNSHYMRALYVGNAGCEPQNSVIAYQGIDEVTFAAAAKSDGTRVPGQILSVSAMAPHKDVDTLIRAFAVVRRRVGAFVRLKLVGAWPDSGYRASMVRLAAELGVADAVEFLGHVSREALHALYARSTVFALMSRCESFGIPSVEAQAFGTPVVCADCCAVREVCGPGGILVAPGDWAGAAEALIGLVGDPALHRELEARAKENASRFRWDSCTAPLWAAFESIAERRA